MQVNVEYNLLDPLLRSTINPDGDVNDATGVQYSPGLLTRILSRASHS
jgi:UDP-sugar pyrophosphorylase